MKYNLISIGYTEFPKLLSGFLIIIQIKLLERFLEKLSKKVICKFLLQTVIFEI